ncbi:MAG: TolC family protein [bacterium]|nr:TolC family protein [bacterium]
MNLPALALLFALPALPQDPPPSTEPGSAETGQGAGQDAGQDPVGEPSIPADPTDTADAAPTAPSLELSVEDALRIALANNIDIRIDEIATEVAAYNRDGSWGAFEWVFDGSYGYTDSEREGGSSLFGGAVVESERDEVDLNLSKALITGGSLTANFNTTTDETSNIFSNAPELTTDLLTLTYVQPLRRGFGAEYARSTQDEARLGWVLQKEVQRLGRQNLRFSVHNAYWDMVDAIQQREVANSALELGVEQLEQNRRRLEAGVGTEVEVLQAQAEVATRIESLLLAHTTVESSTDGLKMLLFSSKDQELWEREIVPVTALPQDTSIAELPGWSDALMVALDMRSELRQQRVEIELARVQHKRSLSERLAGVDLRLSASTGANDEDSGDAFSDTVSWEFPSYTAALSYNMPIGNKTADYAERAARADVRSAILNYDRLELQVLSEVRGGVRDVRYQAEAVRAAEESLRLERRQLEAEEARYTEGLATNFEVLERQQTLIEAMIGERTARTNYAKSLVALQNAQGLLTRDGQRK